SGRQIPNVLVRTQRRFRERQMAQDNRAMSLGEPTRSQVYGGDKAEGQTVGGLVSFGRGRRNRNEGLGERAQAEGSEPRRRKSPVAGGGWNHERAGSGRQRHRDQPVSGREGGIRAQARGVHRGGHRRKAEAQSPAASRSRTTARRKSRVYRSRT